MFQTKFVEEIKTHFVFNNFFPENSAVYEIMRKNIVELDRPQVTIWRMRTACWITKATYTLTVCNTYCFSTATTVARTRLDVTLYVHCLSRFETMYII
jgi:hypothetical protein